jgi:N-acetylgalactosamine-N,N'-diacetylbacillosaminyl-diphospho-undecaprenol 4-alpha-N-acetylgalactosaminyltransferase
LKKVTLFINSLTSGGAERVLSIIATELVAQNIEVNLLCIEEDNAYALPTEIKITYLSSLTKRDSNLKKFIYLPYLAYRVKKYTQKNQTTLIQSHIYRANFINILAKLLGAKHQVQVVEVISINYLTDGSFSKKINFLLIKYLYKYADLVIFKAEKMKEEFLKIFPKINQYKVINNPYNIQKVQKLAQEEVHDFNFDANKKYIITVGRLTSQKRHSTLIEALVHLDENIELIIIGEGELEEKLQETIKQNSVQNRVHLLGKKVNPFKYIKHSNIFVLASQSEGFPNVLVEAMICNTPVISTDCISGPREILAPNTEINFQLKEGIELARNGILYPIDDQQSLIKAINILLNDKEQQQTYRQNGLEKSSEYTLEKIIEQYKEILCVG